MRGRNKMRPDEKFQNTVQVRLTDNQYSNFLQQAESNNLKPAVFGRKLILDNLEIGDEDD